MNSIHNQYTVSQVHHSGNNESSSQDTDQLFDVHPLTGVNLDTFAKQGGLSLVQGERYQVVVIATNEAGGCIDSSSIVTVDTTAPEDGQIYVGPDSQSVSIMLITSHFLLFCIHCYEAILIYIFFFFINYEFCSIIFFLSFI